MDFGREATTAEAESLTAVAVYIKLMRATESVTSRIHSHLAELGLTFSQFGVLEALYHLGPLCQRDLGRKILRSSGNMTAVVDNLETRELVRRARDQVDRRLVNVYITPAGVEVIQQVLPRHIRRIEAEMSVLSAVEQQTLGRLSEKVGRGETGVVGTSRNPGQKNQESLTGSERSKRA